MDPPGTLAVKWVTRERLGKREDPGCLYTFPTLFPDGSATSTQATAAISICWSPATSDTGMSGAPFSHRCRLYAACGTASGIMRAASRCWPQSLPSEPSCTPPRCSPPCLKLSHLFLLIKSSYSRNTLGSVNSVCPPATSICSSN